ncbi:hypothetical protein D3C80_1223840 [compost metagenome]
MTSSRDVASCARASSGAMSAATATPAASVALRRNSILIIAALPNPRSLSFTKQNIIPFDKGLCAYVAYRGVKSC